MHNWRLLLLAFLAVLHPIASFTERNLVDGREQCCNRESVLRDSNLDYGTRFVKLPEGHHLSREIRVDRRYEVRRENPVLNRASVDRRLVEYRSERDARQSSSQPTRLVRAEIRRDYDADNHRGRLSASHDNRERRVRSIHRISLQDTRENDIARVRYSREDIRQQHRDSRGSSRSSTNHEDSRFTRNLDTDNRIRASMESWREARRSRDNPAERRVQEIRKTRDVLQRTRTDVARDENTMARQDRRMATERMEERRSRSESRLQQDNDRVRRSLERRVRETVEDRRSRSTDRVRDSREESRLSRGTSDERRVDHRRKISERLDERRVQRDQRREYRQRSMSEGRESLQRSESASRYIRDSDRARTDFRQIRLARTESQRHTQVEERRVNSREQRAAFENRKESRHTLEIKTVHRDTERKYYRAADRIETRDNRRDVRLIRSYPLEARDREAFPNREYRLAKLMERDTRFRSNPQFTSSPESVAAIQKTPDEKPSAINWQYVFYTLQVIYVCGILTQMLAQKESDKKPRALSWLSAHRSLVKLD